MVYSRIHRLLRILTLIQAQTGWGPARLAAECGVNERTIYRDIDELRAAGIPCDYDAKSDGYRVSDEFFLPPVQITAEEALSLAVLCEQVAEPGQIAHLASAVRALEKIQAAMPSSVREEIEKLAGSIAIRTGPAAPPDTVTEPNHRRAYELIRQAVANRTSLVAEYVPGNQPMTAAAGAPVEKFDFEPYALLYSVRAWYAVGYHSGRDDLRCLKLARFRSLRPTAREFVVPEGFTLERYFGNAWRLVRGPEDYRVEILFDAAFAPTVTDTRWHATQEVERHADGSATLRFTVSGLDEIVWWVLGYGPHARVLGPDVLRDRVRSLASRTADLYANAEQAEHA